MIITCDNKGCMEQGNHLLNEKTNEVICQKCLKPISSITPAMKKILKSFGQVIKAAKAGNAFMLLCKKCRKNVNVGLDANGKTVCVECKSPILVSDSFKLAMQEAGHKLEKID